MQLKRKKISCIGQGYKLLTIRAHSTHEICLKLKARDYSPSDISDATRRLTKLGYLDDAKFCGEYARMRVEKMRLGPKRIMIDLKRKGFEQELIRKAIDDIFSSYDGEIDTAKLAAEKKLRLLKRGMDQGKIKQKLFEHLIRRGFSTNVARRVTLDNIDDVLDEQI